MRVLIVLIAALSLLDDVAAQEPYPARTIRLVAGTAPGGITDTLARTSAEGLSTRLGRLVVVENKAGATGNLAIEHVAKSPPDGYTLLLVAGGNVVITPFLYASLPFDPLNDIVPVFNIAGASQLLVVPRALKTPCRPPDVPPTSGRLITRPGTFASSRPQMSRPPGVPWRRTRRSAAQWSSTWSQSRTFPPSP